MDNLHFLYSSLPDIREFSPNLGALTFPKTNEHHQICVQLFRRHIDNSVYNYIKRNKITIK